MPLRRPALREAMDVVHALIGDRMDHHGDSPFYGYAAQEMARIDVWLTHGPWPDNDFYQSLTHGIGLLCVRELETSDMPFCDAVYGLLEQIRLQAR